MVAIAQHPQTRPASVTVAVTLGWIAVAIDALAGLAAFVLAGNPSVIEALGVDEATVRGHAIASLVIAGAMALVVSRLGRGGSLARLLVTGVLLVRLAAAGWAMAALGSHQLGEALISILISLVGIGLLWNSKASAFFATNRP